MTAADWIPTAVVLICAWAGGTMPDSSEVPARPELAAPPPGGYALSEPGDSLPVG